MSRLGNTFNPLTWFLALALAVVVAGCGGSGSGIDFPGGTGSGTPTAAGAGTGVGGAGRGPAPLDLGAAGTFAILAQSAITNVPTSAVTGDVGVSPATGAGIDLTCAEVTGNIYSADAAGPLPCVIEDATLLGLAIGAKDAAYTDANGRAADYTELGAGDISGLNLGPATYKWGTGVLISSDLTLTGGPNDVWIFQIADTLTVASGVQIILAGGALPENIFWATFSAADFGSTSAFKGIILSQTGIALTTGATLDGRAMAGTAVTLDQNTVTEP